MEMAFSRCQRYEPSLNSTSTGTYHRFIPNVPQEFDCRVKAKIKRSTLDKDIAIKDEAFKTVYTEGYRRKSGPVEKYTRGPKCHTVSHLRTVEEKYLDALPAPLVSEVSEMKDSYRMNFVTHEERVVEPPVVQSRCDVVKLGLEQQPNVPAARRGYWRFTDPYLTNHKIDYIPHEKSELNGNTLTFYNVSDFSLPPASGNKTMFDKATFKNVLPPRFLARSPRRVPNSGMNTDYRDNYVRQTFSDLYPYLHNNGTFFEDPLPPGSRWQNLAAPGMYCSEYCHLGGWPVRTIVEPKPQ